MNVQAQVADQRLVVANLENELASIKEELEELELIVKTELLESVDWDAKKLGPNEAIQRDHIQAYINERIISDRENKSGVGVGILNGRNQMAKISGNLNLARAILQGAIDLLDDEHRRERNALWRELIARLDGDEIKGLLRG